MKRLLLFAVPLLLLAGCRAPKRAAAPPPEVRIDTIYAERRAADTLFIRERERAYSDTILIEREVYRARWRVDTIARVSVDSIPCPYPVEVILEKPKPFLGLTAPRWAAVAAALASLLILLARRRIL